MPTATHFRPNLDDSRREPGPGPPYWCVDQMFSTTESSARVSIRRCAKGRTCGAGRIFPLSTHTAGAGRSPLHDESDYEGIEIRTTLLLQSEQMALWFTKWEDMPNTRPHSNNPKISRKYAASMSRNTGGCWTRRRRGQLGRWSKGHNRGPLPHDRTRAWGLGGRGEPERRSTAQSAGTAARFDPGSVRCGGVALAVLSTALANRVGTMDNGACKQGGGRASARRSGSSLRSKPSGSAMGQSVARARFGHRRGNGRRDEQCRCRWRDHGVVLQRLRIRPELRAGSI